ncbi:MAG: four helix bundle protein [Flavobacteriales bacterium]|jgi:UDP-2-acetamido-3-amino-2,3-dideoxy-glucuronate N-acetyltransferase|nr:four helix bundle protein [Flavobacteriales bacterium]
MATVKQFEDLEIWQLAFQLSNDIYAVIKKTELETDYSLRNQIDRSSISISDNIAEGFERGGNKEFIHFLTIAKASCGEVRSQLYKVHSRSYIDEDKLTNLKEKSVLISKKIGAFISYLQKSDYKENKFKEEQTEYQPETRNLKSETLNPKLFFNHKTAVIDEGCQIGEGTKIWHFSHVMPNCKIGKNCNIGQNVVVSPEVILGNNVKVQNNVSIYTGVICEDDVFLGPSMVFTNVINPRSAINRRGEYAKTIVRKGVSIGANATIVCGNNIGEYAFIGAGAVVTKEVPPYALLVGNPAKQIGWISEYGHRLEFDESGEALCEESKEKYKLENNSVSKIGN